MSKEIKEFLIQKINELSKKFNQISFTYGFDNISGHHLIEIEPEAEYRNEEYMLAEFEVIDSFMNKFPQEQLLFISNDNYIKIENPIYKKAGLINVVNNFSTYTFPLISNSEIISAPFSTLNYSVVFSLDKIEVIKPLLENKNNNIKSSPEINMGEYNWALAA